MSEQPKVINENKDKVESVFIRTVVRQDTYDRLKEFAQRYSTGRGDWDFGVAIQILLDFYEDSKIGLQNDKIDMIINLLQNKQEVSDEDDVIELLGGHTVPRREEK